VFQSILRVHGYAAVGDEQTVRMVPDVDARQDGRVPVDDMRGGGDEPVTRIIQLEHVECQRGLAAAAPAAAAVGLHGCITKAPTA
jgi:hypothetical protein